MVYGLISFRGVTPTPSFCRIQAHSPMRCWIMVCYQNWDQHELFPVLSEQNTWQEAEKLMDQGLNEDAPAEEVILG